MVHDSDNYIIHVPVYLFCDRSLSVLESLVEYLKEILGLSYHKIALLTNRDDRNIWTVYHRVLQKRKGRPKIKIVPRKEAFNDVFIPLDILKDRSLSVLEVVVEHLEKKGFTNHEIAVLLNRDDRTIWTCNNRALKKRKALRGGKNK